MSHDQLTPERRRRWSPRGSAPPAPARIDVNAACSGFVSALALAAGQVESGRARHRARDRRRPDEPPHRPRRPRHRRPVRRRRRRGAGARQPDAAAASARRCSAPTAPAADLITARPDRGDHPDEGPRHLPPGGRPPAPRRRSRRAAAAGPAAGRDRPLRLPPGQRPHPDRGRRAARPRPRAGDRLHRPLRQHLGGDDPARPRRRRSDAGRLEPGAARPAGRLRRRPDLGGDRDRVGAPDRRRAPMPEGCAIVTGSARGIGAATARGARRRRLAGGRQLPLRRRERRGAGRGDRRPTAAARSRSAPTSPTRRRSTSCSSAPRTSSARCWCWSTTPACAPTGSPRSSRTRSGRACSRPTSPPPSTPPAGRCGRCCGPASGGSSTSPRSSGRAPTPARPTTRPRRPGLIGLTKTVAVEVARRGITVNAVAPGLVETKLTEGIVNGLADAIPARRAGHAGGGRRLRALPRLRARPPT